MKYGFKGLWQLHSIVVGYFFYVMHYMEQCLSSSPFFHGLFNGAFGIENSVACRNPFAR
jgi:hypothetical protein